MFASVGNICLIETRVFNQRIIAIKDDEEEESQLLQLLNQFQSLLQGPHVSGIIRNMTSIM